MSLTPGCTVIKDPDASKVYAFEWARWLVSPATIASSSWAITPPAGESPSVLTKDNPTVLSGNTKTQVRLIGGTRGKVYVVTNTIVTNETPAQTDDKSFYLRIAEE